jgi:hypothetical protein
MIPNDPQLREFAIDVGYELKMIAAAGPLAADPELPLLGVALLEATLLHLRNLDTFLAAKKADDDDVIARHYLDSWQGTDILTEQERTDINKRLMHLSAQRLRANAMWDRPELTDRALAAFGRFHLQLTREQPRRARWFDADIADAKRLRRDAHDVILVPVQSS